MFSGTESSRGDNNTTLCIVVGMWHISIYKIRIREMNYVTICIPGVPEKRNGEFSVPYELKLLYLFTSLDQTSSAEENDTTIK